jgi:hypothetical protein
LLVAAALLAASDAFAQGQQPQPYYPPPPPPPQQQPQQPQQQPPQQPSQATPQAPSGPPSAAGSQGTSSTAQPGSPGASSQQVVVNPPSAQQPSTQPAPPSSTTVINPPGATTYRQDTFGVEQRTEASPFATVATDAAWGGLTGLLVGFGVTLVNSFDNWGRDLMVGAGSGVIVGAIVGTVHAAYNAREADRRRHVTYGDGMNRTDRDPVVTSRPVVGFGFRF